MFTHITLQTLLSNHFLPPHSLPFSWFLLQRCHLLSHPELKLRPVTYQMWNITIEKHDWIHTTNEHKISIFAQIWWFEMGFNPLDVKNLNIKMFVSVHITAQTLLHCYILTSFPSCGYMLYYFCATLSCLLLPLFVTTVPRMPFSRDGVSDSV